MRSLDPDFCERIRREHGPDGDVWLQQLPSLLETYAKRWGISLGDPFDLSENYVVAATLANGDESVLKLGPPSRVFTDEIAALTTYGGRGAARMLEYDLEGGALLLERLRPGTTLADLFSETADSELTGIAAGVMKHLRKPPPHSHSFQSLEVWFEELESAAHTASILPQSLVIHAVSQYRGLLDTTTTAALLHADLHHYNILQNASGEWVAIDPQGMVGDPAFEPAAFLRNPIGVTERVRDLVGLMRSRIRILSTDPGLDRARVRAWGLAQNVLSAWWDVTAGNDGWEGAIHTAEAIARTED